MELNFMLLVGIVLVKVSFFKSMNLVKAYNHFQISKRLRKKDTKYFASADTLC